MHLGLADLVSRWVYTRQGVHHLVKSKGFPSPAFTINQGRNPVWVLADIEAYEQNHPELFDNDLKQRKQTGYFLTLMKKPSSSTPPAPPSLVEKLFRRRASGGDT